MAPSVLQGVFFYGILKTIKNFIMKTIKPRKMSPEIEADYFAVKDDLMMYLNQLTKSEDDVAELCSCLAEYQLVNSLGAKTKNPLKAMMDAIYLWKVEV